MFSSRFFGRRYFGFRYWASSSSPGPIYREREFMGAAIFNSSRNENAVFVFQTTVQEAYFTSSIIKPTEL